MEKEDKSVRCSAVKEEYYADLVAVSANSLTITLGLGRIRREWPDDTDILTVERVVLLSNSAARTLHALLGNVIQQLDAAVTSSAKDDAK